ncbi:MAG TPA: histidine phosphatase family protein [Polaromonas sp.]|jgi:alpha-ribazole phosphatase
MKLWLVRHAQPLIEAGVCYGQLDMAADAQATRLCAEALAQVLPPGIAVVTSPLQRCEQLAHVLVGLRPDLTFKTDARLREMDFGSWEGRRWDAIGSAALDAWIADFARHRPGGGESVQAFMQRVAGIWDELWAGTPVPVTDTVWITHAGVIRAATLLQRGLRQITRADQWPTATPGCGEWRVLA